jgi:YVTN family beta-propeller protein
MRRSVLLSAMLITIPTLTGVSKATAHGSPQPGGTVLVTERVLGTVAAFDGTSGTMVWSASTGTSPIGVTVPHGTKKVYTSDEGSNRMSVFDLKTGALITTIATGPAPHHMMASRDGDRIYVAEFGRNTVGVIDTDTDTETASFTASQLPNARTHAVFVAKHGHDLYTTNTRVIRSEPGDVAHIDADAGALICNTTVGADPSEILVTPDGDTGYVSVRGENKIKELDLRSPCPTLTGREALVGVQPDTLQLTPDHATLVVALRGTPATIALVDVRTFTVRPVAIPNHVTTGHNSLSPNGRFSYVAVESPAGFAVIDNRTGALVADHPYPPGGTRAHGIFTIPGRSRHIRCSKDGDT